MTSTSTPRSTSRDIINAKLRAILDDATDKWGTRVVRVEIQRIEPPADVTEAMHRQMKAERLRGLWSRKPKVRRRPGCFKAEGVKTSSIIEAEGQAASIKLVADAGRYQKETLAEGEAAAIERVYSAIHNGNPTPDLVAIKYLEALQVVANGQATKIFLPMDSTVAMGALAAAGELFRDKA